MTQYIPLIVRVLLTFAFTAAGLAKLAGAEMMVATFDAIGWGQWFRYVTGIIELSSSAMLWIPGFQMIGAGLLTITMICAAGFHLLLLGPSAVPALVLGALSAYLVWTHRS